MAIHNGLMEFKYLEGMDFNLKTDQSWSEFFNLKLNLSTQHKTLVVEGGPSYTFDVPADVVSSSFTISKRSETEPVFLYACTTHNPVTDTYESYLALPEGDIRRYPGKRDACISIVDPRHYTGETEYDYEILSYIDEEGMLCHRTSLDNFELEQRIIKIPEECSLVKCGLSVKFRFQYLLMRDSLNFKYVE